jgi:hypothetical protein
MASATLDLPLPLGPTMAVMPLSKTNSVRVAKVLYPWSSSLFSRMMRLDYNLARDRVNGPDLRVGAPVVESASVRLKGC